jgi:hypothetical protein
MNSCLIRSKSQPFLGSAWNCANCLRLLFFPDLGALVPASSSLFLSIESSFVLEFLAPARP